mmetsp:Transcript_15997/g.27091  ORF Transcript_15997/g.27091 Transcript_15997/m.27091 type:complete len:152 (-) Transcript_15997:105-560(-)
MSRRFYSWSILMRPISDYPKRNRSRNDNDLWGLDERSEPKATATATATATSPTEKENGGVVVGLRGKGVKGTKSTESRIIKKEAEEEEQRPRKLSYMERPPDCPINDPPTCVGHPPACVVMGECCGASDRLLEYCFCSGSSYSCTAMCGKC